MDLSGALEGLFGELKFYAALDRKLFAEITIEEGHIDIKIISPVVTAEAMFIHIFKKSRFSSNKLKELKSAGFKITIRWGKLKFSI
jgi:hypothetical protein